MFSSYEKPRNTLFLDLGTKTGYCWGYTHQDAPLHAGTWRLATKDELEQQRKDGNERRHDIRHQRLYEHLIDSLEMGVFRIVYEDVLFSSTTDQTQLWASLRAAVWQIHVNNKNIEIQCVPVGTLKKFATGNGGADKEAMAKALREHAAAPPEVRNEMAWQGTKLDDNAVDAIWLYFFTQHMDKQGQPWNSIWEKRQAEKKLRRDKAKQKKLRLKNKVLTP